MSSPYSTRYYEQLKEDSAGSAREVVPRIVQLFHPASVVDVGCGSGTWARAYAEAGAEILGVDGTTVREDQLVISKDRFTRRNLGAKFSLDRTFDLVNCLEVAEHLSESRADGFVEDLARLGKIIVFSAAVPGQGGTHHVNEQWPTYWISRFSKHGFVSVDCLRPVFWNNPKVAWWYVQNMFAFIHRDRLPEFADVQRSAPAWPVDVVHPRAYVRATVPEQMSPRMLKEVLRALPHFPGKVLAHFRG